MKIHGEVRNNPATTAAKVAEPITIVIDGDDPSVERLMDTKNPAKVFVEIVERKTGLTKARILL